MKDLMKPLKKLTLFVLFVLTFKSASGQICISLSSASGTDAQTVCINEPIVPITYTLGVGVTASVTGLPTGVTGSLQAHTFTIQGSPTVTGSFDYTITTVGMCLGSPTASGKIMVNPLPVVTFGGVLTPQCVNSTAYTLTGGLPAGGTYSGPGVSGTNFNASVAGVGTHTITYTYKDITGCENFATNSITVNPLPLVSFPGTLTPQCASSTVYTLTGGTPAGGTYSGPGVTGTNFNASIAGAGIHIITYSYTNASGCTNTATNTITVNPVPLPTLVSSDADNVFCAGTSVTFTAGGGQNYNFRINSISVQSGTSTIYTTSSLTNGQIVDVVVTNSYNCTATSLPIQNIVNPNPVAAATNNGPVCPGTRLSLTGGPAGMLAYTWIGPNGYSSGLISPVVTESATEAMEGVYSLTVTDSHACQNTALTNVIVNPVPSVTAASNGPVCEGLPLTLTGGPVGMTSYQWTGPNGFSSIARSPQVSASATLAMAGTYTLTVTDINGCQNSATTVVVVNPLPVATASNNGPVCAGTPLTLSGGPAGMTSYGWTGPGGFTSVAQNPVVSTQAGAEMAGPYTLTVINSNGCRNTAVTTAVVNPSPIATATNNGPLCEGSQLTLTGGPAGMTTYAWTGPNSFTSAVRSPIVSPAATTLMSGIYVLTVTNTSGCQDTAGTRANVFAMPVSNAGTGGVECDLNFVLNAVPGIGTGLWSVVTGPGTATFAPGPASPTATVTVSAYGTYTFRWTVTNGPCLSSSVVTVNFYQPPVANPGTGGDECDQDFSLNAVPSSGTGTWTMISGTGVATFSPGSGSPTANVAVSEYGVKIFQWKESNGTCADSANITVNFYQQPVANPGTGASNCGLDYNLHATPSIGIGTWTRESGPGTASFNPGAGSPTPKVTVSAYGTYVFRWTEVNGTCSSSATISVTFIQQPSAIAGSGGDHCDLTFQLNATPATGTGTWSKVSGPGNVLFTPNANQPDAIVTVTQFGSYDLAWTVVNSLCTSSDIIRVSLHDLPELNAGPDAVICKGRSIQLNAAGTGSFQWAPANLLNNPSIHNPVATPTISTLFTVTLTDQWGCKNNDQVGVEVRPQPVADAGPDQVLDFLFETALDATPAGPGQTGEWTVVKGKGDFSDPGDPKAFVSHLDLNLNSFIWTVNNGVCPVSADTVNITVHDLRIPTMITPNLDGKNDFFVINGIESLGKTRLTVFNRWGGRLYEKVNYDNKWNGVDLNEDDLPEDTYFFILETEKSGIIKGFIVIRR